MTACMIILRPSPERPRHAPDAAVTDTPMYTSSIEDPMAFSLLKNHTRSAQT